MSRVTSWEKVGKLFYPMVDLGLRASLRWLNENLLDDQGHTGHKAIAVHLPGGD